jgi:hypothetical protein
MNVDPSQPGCYYITSLTQKIFNAQKKLQLPPNLKYWVGGGGAQTRTAARIREKPHQGMPAYTKTAGTQVNKLQFLNSCALFCCRSGFQRDDQVSSFWKLCSIIYSDYAGCREK